MDQAALDCEEAKRVQVAGLKFVLYVLVIATGDQQEQVRNQRWSGRISCWAETDPGQGSLDGRVCNELCWNLVVEEKGITMEVGHRWVLKLQTVPTG